MAGYYESLTWCQVADIGSTRVGSDDLEWPWKAERDGSTFLGISVRTLIPFGQRRPNLAR